MKLVVAFASDGDYECPSHTFYKCVEYDSVEAFYVDFTDKIVEYKAYQAVYDMNVQEWHKKNEWWEYGYSSMNEKWLQFKKENADPSEKFDNFEFAGVIWNRDDLDCFTGTVETLEDWWKNRNHEDGGGHIDGTYF